MDIKSALKQLRKNNNISQDQLADLIGKSRHVVSNWERGLTTPTDADLVLIANSLSVDPKPLLSAADDSITELKDLFSKSNSIFSSNLRSREEKDKIMKELLELYMKNI